MTDHRLYSVCLVLLLFALPASAQPSDEAEQAELAKKTQNPVGDLISLPFQNNTSFGIGPNDRTQNVTNIQPVVPVTWGYEGVPAPEGVKSTTLPPESATATVTVSGTTYHYYKNTVYQGRSEGKDTARKVAGGAGLGAVIGAIADGGQGAAIGAAVGAGVGTVASAATEGEQAVIGEGAVIQFGLEEAVSVPTAATVATADATRL